MRHRSRLLAAVALVGAVIASSGGAAVAARPAAKAAYTIMSINPEPGFGLNWTIGGQGLYQRVDEAGGIDGHQINFTQCSDGTFVLQSQDLSYTCAQTAVSNHVLAVVGSNSQYDSVIYPVLAANHIPDIGSFPMQPVDYTSPESTPFLSPGIVLDAGEAIELKQAGHCKKIAFLDEANTSITAASDDSFAAGAKWAHVAVAPAVDIPSTVSDYAPTIAVLDGEGVDCVAWGLNGASFAGLITAISDSGHPMKIVFNPAGTPTSAIQAIGPVANGILLNDSAEYDAIITNFNPPKATAGEKQMLSDFARFPAALNTGPLSAPGWQAADAFEIVLKDLIKRGLPVTGANMLKVLKTATINTGVFLSANFSTKGPIPGYPRVHNTFTNWGIIRNLTYVPLDYANHPVGPALAHFHG